MPDAYPFWLLKPIFRAKGSSSNADRRNRWASLAKPALGVALALGALAAGRAQAVVVNVGGQDWDVTTFTGSYNVNTSKFATAANGGVMPWWGDSSKAGQFSALVDTQLCSSLNACGTIGHVCGPFFAYYLSSGAIQNWRLNNTLNQQQNTSPSGAGFSVSRTWAQATLYTPPAAPVPGPLSALGGAAALGFSRQLRKRIKGSTNALFSTYSL
jgi:hypothetical protein